jgi:hypothetical protein
MPATPSLSGPGGHESSAECGAPMATDQLYCVGCGERRAPFVAASAAPASPGATGRPTPPPPPSRTGGPLTWNANGILTAAVAVLILAMGVGYLIGRSGPEGSGATKVIFKVDGGGAGESLTPEAAPDGKGKTGSSSTSPEAKGHATPGKKSASPKAKDEGGAPHEEAPPPSAAITQPVVPQAKETAKVGEACEEGTAGCGPDHIFEGEFFPE